MIAIGRPAHPPGKILLATAGWAWLVSCAVHGEIAAEPAEPLAGIRLPFRPASSALSEDGQYAAVWEAHAGVAGTAGPRLCLVDLQARQVASQRELKHRIVAVTLGTRAVLVLHGEVIQVLRRTDLSPVASIALSQAAADIRLVDDRWLFVRQPRSWSALQLPERVESPWLRMLLADLRGADVPPVVSVPGGRQVGSAVLDDTLQHVRFFRAVPQLAHTDLISQPGDWAPTASASGRRPTPQSASLSVHPQPGTLVLSVRQKTVIPYIISGGQGPYVVRPAARRQPGRAELQDLAVAGGHPHSLVVDGARIAAVACEDQFGLALAAKIRTRVGLRGGDSADDLVAAYLDQANRALAPCVEETFRDVPVAVAVGVTVTDATAASVSLSHDMILELPRARIVALVERELPRRSPDAGRDDAWADTGGNRMPAIELPLLWPADAGPTFVSELTRRTWPPITLPQEAVDSLAAAICVRSLDVDFKFAAVTHPQDDPRPERTWKTRTGRTLTGRLTEVFGGNLSIAGPAAAGHVPAGQLDAASLRWAWQDISRFQRTDAAYEKRKLWLLGRALQAYYNDHGCFPPQALVAADGRPLLSWRVLLLPYLGQAGLLRLFRLSEPWDSPHNRQLIPYMPLLYTTAERPLDPGYSNVVAVAGPQMAFPPRSLRRLSEFTDPPEETLVMVDVVEQGAVPWTQPADLDLSAGLHACQRLYKRAVPRGFGEPAVPRCTGIFADGTVAYFAPQFVPDLLLNAARVDDGQWGGLRLDDRP